jgi:hypothetical protein
MLQDWQINQSPRARQNGLICENISGEYVVYDTLDKKAHHLNTSLTWIWRKCDGTNTVDSIASGIEQEFGIENGLQVVFSSLKQLQDCNLLETGIDVPQLPPDVNAGVSRRAVVGGGSLVLPAVVSILAPAAAAAKSDPKGPKDPKDPKDPKPKQKIKF